VSVPANDVDQDLVLRLYRTVTTIRAAELRIREHITEHGYGGFWHPGIGHEGLHAGAIAALEDRDNLFYAHRGLGYLVAKGMDLVEIFGDMLGRVCGSTGGKGAGIAHFADPGRRVMGQGGTLGSNFAMGAGAAASAQLLGEDRVTAVFFGDGAASRGTFHEAALQASSWKLPVVWVCENNGWAISARFSEQSPTPNVADRAVAYGMPGVVVDGLDALAVHAAMNEAVARARRGEGPSLIEGKTVRARGHYEGDQQRYREERVDQNQIPNDPLLALRSRLPREQADELDEQAQLCVDTSFQAALDSPLPDPSIIYEDVWAG
jgi:TPP-dependent pyruvate/acetoin dehydrogenase alpha subunit